jgi:penicillin-binding protein 1A
MEATSKPTPASKPRVWVSNSRRAGLLGWLFRYYALTALLLAFATFWIGRGLYRYFAAELPDLTEIEQYETMAPGVTRIYSADGALLAELAREHRSYARIDEMPDDLVNAVLAAEDRRFREHLGLDFRGLARAIVTNVRQGTVVQGGSTITQQVSKKFLSEERTLERKLREAILSLRLEARLGKERILEIYLNKIFLGHGAYGVSAAASRYFDKSLDELTLAESALVAGLARAPSRYSPTTNTEAAIARRAVVLTDMVEAGYITQEERDVAAAEPLALAKIRDPFRWRDPFYAEHVRQDVTELLGEDAVLQDGLQIETPASLELRSQASSSIDKALRRMDRRQGYRGPVAHLRDDDSRNELEDRLRNAYGQAPASDHERWFLALVKKVEPRLATVSLGAIEAELPLSGMRWAAPYDRNTGLNDQTITDVSTALEEGDVIYVHSVAPKQGAPEAGVVKVKLGQTPRVEAALYSFDHRTGYVEVMQGGHDYDRSQYNRTTQACRQPGSVYKAIYYSLALDSRDWRMDSILEGKPWEPEEGEEWNPRNIDKTLDGKVLLRTAFIKSLNTPSIRLFLRLGADEVVDWSRRLGFSSELIADKALSLGASCVHTNELSRAFAILVQGGKWVDPVYVRRITDKRGRTVVDQRHPTDGAMDVAARIDRMAALAVEAPEQLVDERTAFLITRLMREVVTSGTSTRATTIGVPAGGKSGTASKGTYTTDTWFVGFTSRHLTAAWMGDDKYERSLGEEDASYTTAIPMWADYMKKVVEPLPQHQKLPLERPPGITQKIVDATHGGPPVEGLPQATVYYASGSVNHL